MNNPVPGLPGVINIHKKHDDGTLGSRHAVTVFFFFFAVWVPCPGGRGRTDPCIKAGAKALSPKFSRRHQPSAASVHARLIPPGQGDMTLCFPMGVACKWTAGRAGLVEHACQKQCARPAPPHPCRGSRWPGLQGGGGGRPPEGGA